MTQTTYEYQDVEGGSPIKMWTRGVPVDDKAREQLTKAAKMSFIFKLWPCPTCTWGSARPWVR